jgi:hypothetical protein
VHLGRKGRDFLFTGSPPCAGLRAGTGRDTSRRHAWRRDASEQPTATAQRAHCDARSTRPGSAARSSARATRRPHIALNARSLGIQENERRSERRMVRGFCGGGARLDGNDRVNGPPGPRGGSRRVRRGRSHASNAASRRRVEPRNTPGAGVATSHRSPDQLQGVRVARSQWRPLSAETMHAAG